MTTRSQVQINWGTAAEIATYVGVARELILDTTNNRLVITDGVTAGGVAVIPNKAYVDNLVAGFSANVASNLGLWASCG
jgi:Major tropism determinant N-terminal domain